VNRVDQLLNRFVRGLTLGPPNQEPRLRPETVEPGERAHVPASRLVLGYALAVVLPIAIAAGLIPLRAEHGHATAIVLVVPVLIVAVIGATGPAILAALAAGLAYDLLLTEPYYKLVIDDPDDVTAAITLVVVGLVVGLLSSQLARLSARDAARRNELHHLLEFARSTTIGNDEQALLDAACSHISAVLDLRACRWHAGYQGGGGPMLLPDGSIMGYVTELNPDRAILPEDLELPALVGNDERGRFILTPRPGRITSLEERLTAATIANMFAATLSP
jgi:hypothetical protein